GISTVIHCATSATEHSDSIRSAYTFFINLKMFGNDLERQYDRHVCTFPSNKASPLCLNTPIVPL
ncbi:MAG: hypothetical protein AAGI49_10045, partial [Bacteroidota bacterium]